MLTKHYNNSTLATPLPSDSCHMYNFIHQNEINMANKPIKIQELFLGIDEQPFITNAEQSPVTKSNNRSCSRKFIDGE